MVKIQRQWKILVTIRILDILKKKDGLAKEVNGLKEIQKKEQRTRSLFGLAVITVGFWWLLRRMNLESAPDFLFTWSAVVIALGLFHVIVNGFKASGG